MAEVNLLLSQNNCICNNTFLFLLIDPDLWTTSVVFCHLAVQPFCWFSMTLRGKGALGCYFLDSANSVLFWEFKKLQEWWAMVMIRCASVKIHSCCIHPLEQCCPPTPLLYRCVCSWLLVLRTWQCSTAQPEGSWTHFTHPVCQPGHPQGFGWLLWFQSLSLHQ